MFNAYGPTEHGLATIHRCDGNEVVTVPIGHPIANTQIYVLDRHGEPSSWGWPGNCTLVARVWHEVT